MQGNPLVTQTGWSWYVVIFLLLVISNHFFDISFALLETSFHPLVANICYVSCLLDVLSYAVGFTLVLFVSFMTEHAEHAEHAELQQDGRNCQLHPHR